MKDLSMQDWIRKLETDSELKRIKVPVSSDQEIAEISDRMMKQENGGKALLFENTGTDFPLLINAYGSVERMQTVFWR